MSLYPSAPNFTEGGRSSAWWTYARDNGTQNVCAAEPASLIASIRAVIGAGYGRQWDDALQSRLIQIATAASASNPAAWSQLLLVLNTDARNRIVSPVSLQYAIYLAFYAASGLRLDALRIPDGATMPVWNVAPPTVDGDIGIVCWVPSRDAPVTTLSPADLVAAREQSRLGVRVLPGETPPAPIPNVPSGPAGISTPVLAVGIVGFVCLIAALAWPSGSREPKRSTSVKRRG